MKIRNKLKDFALFVDGEGYAGTADEITLPKLTLKTEEHLAGGMEAPIEVVTGLEKLEMDFTLRGYSAEVLKLWGLVNNREIPFTLRGSIEDDEKTQNITVQMRGMIREIDFDTLKAGEDSTCKFSLALSYYKLTMDGNELIEIDIENMVRKINGEDQLANRRKNLGL